MAYKAYVTELKNVRKHPNADRLLLGDCFGNTVCVNLDYVEGQLGVYFPTDGQLSVEFADANNLGLGGAIGFTELVEHLDGIGGYHFVEHVADFVGGCEDVADDEGVETYAVDELEPGHVDLGSGTTTPLSGFKYDDSYGLAVLAVFFKTAYE